LEIISSSPSEIFNSILPSPIESSKSTDATAKPKQQQQTAHNFTDYIPSQSQTQLLNLGTTFVIPPALNRNQLQNDINNFKRKIRNKY